nr:MAG TPA: major capsid protein [Caudoviricetes sp.]
MPNAITTAVSYPGDMLDQKLVQKSVTGMFVDNTFGAKFINNETVMLADRDFIGLGNYTRNGVGFPEGDITIGREPYKLTMERGRGFFIDAMDVDESGLSFDKIMGHEMGDYIKEHVAPEKDAYVLSTAYSVADEMGHTEVFSEAAPFGQLVDLIDNVGDICGYDSENVAFVDRVAYSAMRKSTEFQKMVDAASFKQGGIDITVKRLDNTYIIPVPSARMKSKYIFADGGETSVGGFTPMEGAKNIRMLVLPKTDISLVIKHTALRVFPPNVYQPKDGYSMQYRILYDAFIKKSRKGHLFAAYGN